MIIFKVDSRNLDFYRKFGRAIDLPTDLNFDRNTPDTVQVPGNTECTCISICDVAYDVTGVEYDYDELFSRIPHDINGAEPRKVIKEVIDGKGLKRKDTGVYEKPFTSYWQPQTGDMDAFDNCRSALALSGRSFIIWSPWYREWEDKITLPLGMTISSGHMYVVEGVKTFGEPELVIEAFVGRKLYMPRDVFNKTIGSWGAGAAVLSDSSVDAKRKKTFIETIIDLCKNAILLIQQLQLKQEPMPSTPEESIVLEHKLYDTAFALKGQHLSLDESVPKEYGCAQCMSFIFKKCGYPIPEKGISGTALMDIWLQKNATLLDISEFGCVIISVTEGENRGHIGIVGHYAILSNDSQSGLLQPYWSVPAWMDYYSFQKGLKTKFYKL